MSAAPEIAILAGATLLVPARPASRPRQVPRVTLGTLAGRLRMLAATPERWWGLVRFEPDRSVMIRVEDQPEYEAWLVVLPPGDAGQDCDCDAATIIAGEATEGAPGSAVLRPGPTRVHGQPHRLQGHGAGYSISLHARATPSVLCESSRYAQDPLWLPPAPPAPCWLYARVTQVPAAVLAVAGHRPLARACGPYSLGRSWVTLPGRSRRPRRPALASRLCITLSGIHEP